MSEKRNAFPETTKKEWLAAARKELGGDNPLDKLSFQAGDLTLQPYYDASDVHEGSEGQRIGAPRIWVNAPRIAVTDAIGANSTALTHLQEGADGLLFEILDSDTNIADLFSGIELPFCSVYFCGNASTSFLERFGRYAAEKFTPGQIRGAAYGLSASGLAAIQPLYKAFDQFRTLGLVHDKPATDAAALSQLLKELNERFEIISPGAAIPDTSLLLTLSDDFFGEMIRIHALSMLWRCFQDAYGADKARLHIHAWSRSLNDSEYEPQGNMISSVARAVSSVIAGVNVLTIDSQSQEPFQSRTARNISFILHEESQLARASNMLDGTYFIEAASKKLAVETWSKFQTLVRK